MIHEGGSVGYPLIMSDPITIAPNFAIPAAETLAAVNLSPLDIPDSDKPLYETRLGAYFDKDWVREARAVRRRQMLEESSQQSREIRSEAQSVRPLDVIDWESQIILNSAYVTRQHSLLCMLIIQDRSAGQVLRTPQTP